MMEYILSQYTRVNINTFGHKIINAVRKYLSIQYPHAARSI